MLRDKGYSVEAKDAAQIMIYAWRADLPAGHHDPAPGPKRAREFSRTRALCE